jgi:hypothetical protein
MRESHAAELRKAEAQNAAEMLRLQVSPSCVDGIFECASLLCATRPCPEVSLTIFALSCLVVESAQS